MFSHLNFTQQGAHSRFKHGQRMGKILHPVVFVFCGPSGTGKSTLLQRLIQTQNDSFTFAISHTTRAIRQNEINGRDYHFVSAEKMDELIRNKAFLEHVTFAKNMYGCTNDAIQEVLSSGRHCSLDLTIEGVKTMHALSAEMNIKYVLIVPPSLTLLEERLRGRRTESEEQRKTRLQIGQQDLEYVNSPQGQALFDKRIVNETLEVAYSELLSYLRGFPLCVQVKPSLHS